MEACQLWFFLKIKLKAYFSVKATHLLNRYKLQIFTGYKTIISQKGFLEEAECAQTCRILRYYRVLWVDKGHPVGWGWGQQVRAFQSPKWLQLPSCGTQKSSPTMSPANRSTEFVDMGRVWVGLSWAFLYFEGCSVGGTWSRNMSYFLWWWHCHGLPTGLGHILLLPHFRLNKTPWSLSKIK